MPVIGLKIESRSGKVLANIDVDSEDTVAQLKKKYHALAKKYYPARQRLTLPPKEGQKSGEALKDSAKLSDYGLTNGSSVQFKDLGPQIDYSTVFFFEYFGPLVIYPLFFALPQLFYGVAVPMHERALVQKIAAAYWVFHYAKRIFETYFVHTFGHDTMPIRNLFKNCSYYYGFAAYVAYFVNHPRYTAPPVAQSLVCFALALLCQLSNLRCHIILANLRKPGERGYKIPAGFLFNYITCANYTAEIWGWILFTIGTQTAAAGLFTAAGAFQMAEWARGKHRRLVKLFDGKEGREKYPKRWVMFPPFL
ncbi:hypothetical protein HT031_002903 [Scenedesmus sp. PABB004]|nr:hypothetical protein HT031_002903 [Scenedesmus sp. PABB004]